MTTHGLYDLLLKGGRLIDPQQKRDGQFDVAIVGGRIAAVQPDILPSAARQVIDVRGKLVTPGLIDTHAHIYQYVAGPFALNADAVGVRSGVATMVDQGGPSCLTIDGFRKYVVEGSATRVYCYISTYLVGGLYGHRHIQLYSPDCIDVNATLRSIEANRDIVRGIKAHAEPGTYSRWGLGVLQKAKEIGRAAKLPVYVHLGTLWPTRDGKQVDPAQILAEALPLMDEGDVLAHPFTRHPSGFTDEQGKVHPLVFEAIKKGVVIDVGRGSHFSSAVARAVTDAGIAPYTLGADLHGHNIKPASAESRSAGAAESPTFSLHYAMSEMLALGHTVEKIIPMVTANPAALLREQDKIGGLAPGRIADIAVMELQSGEFTLRDGLGKECTASKRFRPVFSLRNGALQQPDSEYLPFWERDAAAAPTLVSA